MSKVFGSSLIIVGTSVGAGMLGLPVEMGAGGFFPSVVFFILVWLATTISALLLAQVTVKFPPGANFISISEKLLSRQMRGVILIVYVLLFFSLVTAYVKGGGMFFSQLLRIEFTGFGSLLFLILFLPFICFGVKFVEKINLLLVVFLFLSFFYLVSLSIGYVNQNFLTHSDWKQSYLSLPFIITAFSYHATLPTIVQYLKNDLRKIRKAIFSGSFMTLMIYLLWQYVVLGCVPWKGEGGLQVALDLDQTAIYPLKLLLNHPWISKVGECFSFFALTTSFLGVSIGMIDFFIDALKVKKSVKTRFFMAIAIFIPAFLLSVTKLRIFYLSLKYGGGFSCLFLLIFLPALMSYRSKKGKNILHKGRWEPVIFAFSCFAATAILLNFF